MKAERTKRIIAFLADGAAATYALVARRRSGAGLRASLRMRAVELLFRLKGKGHMIDAVATAEKYRRRSYPAPPPIPRSLRARCEVREELVQGRQVFTLTLKTGVSLAHIIYTYGGGYVNALTGPHWWIIRQLIEKTCAAVTVPIYPLAPEYTYRTTYTLLEEVYRRVIAKTPPDQVVLCGDSAGGGLALGQALYYRDLGLSPPGRVILFSPWLDITMSNPGAAAAEKDDAMLALPGLVEAGKWWAGGDDPKSPLLSPLFGDLKGLPPIDVFQGTHDVFIADARELKERVTATGSEIHLYEYPGAFHVFVGATFTPEARDAFRKAAMSVNALSSSQPGYPGA
jgi:epsilon-lactone hydrolase